MTHLERDNHMHFKTWYDEKYDRAELSDISFVFLSFKLYSEGISILILQWTRILKSFED